ncbi:hypothetical protein D8B26_005220 [Coccidioides posadasii str. Silveira]|uniref:Kinetochore protein Sos7 coiled-coil domain-containing protein n=3 Tax=Coccidioides posadasii TaxID=199306 RepID=E9D4K9_COCPS|nr:hypothetical protein CPC735_058300 [Coccidioides posadasii C735 delta SOWgp]EER24460.1 hypothetical protein CPC735_058300 [Coccidioides posadasii C735 delta SOWgp]EFW18441.1 conserved hypothetical protein [Coccidioides posadasii str. Silveira]KMM66177.1 hypothetical protein CPAG_02517 [Coccidioides posadasii RMSCC 3488]QVM10562.1 hypothetical protein D8B26_005220 [Coccidioides posadasii str. Silveira]|eukprot:XP_003066605.1 hypothetical protein CPC735_058300 [Coccidioides posadasii C735 delta SOWgp]
MAPPKSLSDIRAELEELDAAYPELSIIRISEPIASNADVVDENKLNQLSPSKQRISDVSTNGFENPTPTALEADLAHYKELFSKLRFSYLEQVTKEKFLRAIVGDPPLVVGHNDNVELEAQLALVKADLKERKKEVADLIEQMEKSGRDLASRYKKVQLQTTQLAELPSSISELENTIAELRASSANASQSPESGDVPASQTLSLQDTLALLAEREAELASLNHQLSSVGPVLPRKAREAEAAEREIAGLERRRNEVVAQARETRRRKNEGESDGLEEMGRWYKGVEQGLKSLVGT